MLTTISSTILNFVTELDNAQLLGLVLKPISPDKIEILIFYIKMLMMKNFIMSQKVNLIIVELSSL